MATDTDDLLIDLIGRYNDVADRQESVLAAQNVLGFVPPSAATLGAMLQAETAKGDSRLVHLPGGEQALGQAVQPVTGALFVSPAARIADPHNLRPRGFWPDKDNGANIWRLGDRVFVGKACQVTGSFAGSQGEASPAPLSQAGANWGLRDATLLSVATNGNMAVVGFARHADHPVGQVPTETIGVAGFVIASTAGRSSHALYGDVQFEAGSYGYGLELAVKNKGADVTSTPYFATTGTYGIWLPGGGDASYGGAPTAPNNTAIAIGKNATTWNKGLLFFQDGLTRDGGGQATAIEMAKGHMIVWRTPGNQIGARIRSEVTSAGSDVSITFIDNVTNFVGANGKTIFATQYQAGAVNYVAARGGATGAAAALTANGDDGNVDLALLPKGTGLVRFGALTTTADVAITGYISIKDAGGTVRKLAVVA